MKVAVFFTLFVFSAALASKALFGALFHWLSVYKWKKGQPKDLVPETVRALDIVARWEFWEWLLAGTLLLPWLLVAWFLIGAVTLVKDNERAS